MHIFGIRIDFVGPQDFGHPATQFYGLIALMTSISLALWGIVLLTSVVRFVACRVVYRSRRRGRRVLADEVVAQNGNG